MRRALTDRTPLSASPKRYAGSVSLSLVGCAESWSSYSRRHYLYLSSAGFWALAFCASFFRRGARMDIFLFS